jgi:hypothetical protein
VIKLETSVDLYHVRSENKVVEIEYYIGGAPAGRVMIDAAPGMINAQAVRAAVSADGKFELCRIAVNQGLTGKKLDKLVLRDELSSSLLQAE